MGQITEAMSNVLATRATLTKAGPSASAFFFLFQVQNHSALNLIHVVCASSRNIEQQTVRLFSDPQGPEKTLNVPRK